MIVLPFAAKRTGGGEGRFAASGNSDGLNTNTSFTGCNDGTPAEVASGTIPFRKWLLSPVIFKKIANIATLPALCG
jgi:hypothetical protein